MKFLVPALALLTIAACGTQDNGVADSKTPPPAADATPVTYATIKPIFDSRCVGCHGADDPKDGVNLTDYASVMKGGKDGPIVVSGEPSASLLLKVIDGSESPRMPFKQDPLTQEQIDQVSQWIAQGAKE